MAVGVTFDVIDGVGVALGVTGGVDPMVDVGVGAAHHQCLAPVDAAQRVAGQASAGAALGIWARTGCGWDRAGTDGLVG